MVPEAGDGRWCQAQRCSASFSVLSCRSLRDLYFNLYDMNDTRITMQKKEYLKGFFNLVEKYMSTIIDFWLYVSPESIYQYIVDGNIVTHSDCSRFPNAIESGIPMS